MLILNRFRFVINHFFLQISNQKHWTKTSSWTQLYVFSKEFVPVTEFLFSIHNWKGFLFLHSPKVKYKYNVSSVLILKHFTRIA